MTLDLSTPIALGLPDLEPNTAIQQDNIRALQATYVAALLEGLRIFDVAELLVDHFLAGQLPLDRQGRAEVDLYLRDLPNRLTDRERHALYARAFGMPGGDSGEPQVNREFDDLWARFLVAVDELVRQVPEPTPGGPPVSQQGVKQAARDLAANLSLHGDGIGHFAAVALQTQIKSAIHLLSTPSLLDAFSARDIWQVIEIVSASELGGAHNPWRYRTMAISGGIMIGWLACRAEMLTSAGPNLLDLSAIDGPPSPSPLATPTDRDLVDACRSWIAAVWQ